MAEVVIYVQGPASISEGAMMDLRAFRTEVPTSEHRMKTSFDGMLSHKLGILRIQSNPGKGWRECVETSVVDGRLFSLHTESDGCTV